MHGRCHAQLRTFVGPQETAFKVMAVLGAVEAEAAERTTLHSIDGSSSHVQPFMTICWTRVACNVPLHRTRHAPTALAK